MGCEGLFGEVAVVALAVVVVGGCCGDAVAGAGAAGGRVFVGHYGVAVVSSGADDGLFLVGGIILVVHGCDWGVDLFPWRNWLLMA